jgi:hypothetical membrane protein
VTTAELTKSHAPSRVVAAGGALAVLMTIVMIGSLDVRRVLASVDLSRSTISAYGLGPNGWIFEVAVSLLAGGSLAILAVLVHRGITRWTAPGAIALSLWSLGLAMVVAFPKQDWSMPETASGGIHRIGSLIAFVSLPIAALLLSRPWLKHEVWRTNARWTFGLGILSVLAFSPLLYALVSHALLGGTAWWRAIPLGYVERVLVITEVCAVLAAGLWAIAASNRPKLA